MTKARTHRDGTELGPALMAHFDALCIINLPDRADRRAEVNHELRRVGLAPGTLGVGFFEATRGTGPHGFASAGAHGCFLSHLAVLETALARGHRAVLVAEDDLEFILPTGHDLTALLAPLAGDRWDFFFGGYHHPKRFLIDGTGLVDLGARYSIGGAHLYGVHRRVLPDLIAHLRAHLPENRLTRPEDGHFDPILSTFRKTRPGCVTHVLSPALARQRRSRSDIQQLAFYDRVPLLRALIDSARRVLPGRNV